MTNNNIYFYHLSYIEDEFEPIEQTAQVAFPVKLTEEQEKFLSSCAYRIIHTSDYECGTLEEALTDVLRLFWNRFGINGNPFLTPYTKYLVVEKDEPSSNLQLWATNIAWEVDEEGLPSEVKVPSDLYDDEEEIADWLSDEFGWCHEGFELEWR